MGRSLSALVSTRKSSWAILYLLKLLKSIWSVSQSRERIKPDDVSSVENLMDPDDYEAFLETAD